MSDSVKAAIAKFYEREKKKLEGPTRRNTNPEKCVEEACVIWMKSQNWTGQVYESKAKLINGRWQSSGLKFGHSDWMGNTPDGITACVEFKAPGARSSFNKEKNHRQRQFIIERINSNCFACVVDSADCLSATYFVWQKLREHDGMERAKQYLLDALPKINTGRARKVKGDISDLFE